MSENDITLALLVDTYFRLAEQPENQKKDSSILIEEAYQLLKDCQEQLDPSHDREQLEAHLEVEREERSLVREASRISEQERVPWSDALKEVLENPSRHFQERFALYLRTGASSLIREVAKRTDFKKLGIPISLIPELREGFAEWNRAKVRRSKVRNAKSRKNPKEF